MSAEERKDRADDSERLLPAAEMLRMAGWTVIPTSLGVLCSLPVGPISSGNTITERWRENNISKGAGKKQNPDSCP